VIATRGNRPSSFIVDGGHALEGTIAVGGAKNSVLKILAASVLYEKPLTITNVPLIEDVFRMIELLEHAGATVERVGEHEFRIDASGIRNQKSRNVFVALLCW